MNYVSGVIGIFLVLLTAYWLVYGSRFEGPVSRRLKSLREYTADVARRNSMLSWVSRMTRERSDVRIENTLKESGRLSRFSKTPQGFSRRDEAQAVCCCAGLALYWELLLHSNIRLLLVKT
jgi:hypothetical protein